jgi:hypothetical protein
MPGATHSPGYQIKRSTGVESVEVVVSLKVRIIYLTDIAVKICPDIAEVRGYSTIYDRKLVEICQIRRVQNIPGQHFIGFYRSVSFESSCIISMHRIDDNCIGVSQDKPG